LTPRYTPPDAGAAPRYTGIRTFARAPHVTSAEAVDVAVLGVPFDTATSMRPGARFGPAGIRDASLLLRPWNPAHKVDVFGSISLTDLGDDRARRVAAGRPRSWPRTSPTSSSP
jgi:agmatinase